MDGRTRDERTRIDDVRTDFIERMGVVAQAEGMPRIAGQIFAMLVFDGEAVAFGELATRLEVSRATVSTSIRLLEERGLIRRVNRRGDRQDYFQQADDAFATMMKHAAAGTERARAEIDETIARLPEEAADVRARLADYAGFYEAISASLAQAITRVSKTRP